jgi:hypothetical protein
LHLTISDEIKRPPSLHRNSGVSNPLPSRFKACSARDGEIGKNSQRQGVHRTWARRSGVKDHDLVLEGVHGFLVSKWAVSGFSLFLEVFRVDGSVERTE